MKQLTIKVLQYSFLFIALYFCSIIIVKLFSLFGLNYINQSNTAFYGALFSILFLMVINVRKKNGGKFRR